MTGRLQGKIAIVTGAGQGIGAATARAFAMQGAKTVIAELNAATGKADRVGFRFEDGKKVRFFKSNSETIK